jgi:hypothetical protein
MEQVDYIRLQDAYGGKFIAIRKDQIVASANSHGELVRKLKAKKLDAEDLVFEYVRPTGRACAY